MMARRVFRLRPPSCMCVSFWHSLSLSVACRLLYNAHMGNINDQNFEREMLKKCKLAVSRSRAFVCTYTQTQCKIAKTIQTDRTKNLFF